MKRTFIIITALCALSFAAKAENVSVSQARQLAADFFFGKRNTDTKALEVRISLIDEPVSSGSSVIQSCPEYYIFNSSEGGFVIISGENSILPVIAYSPDGHFEPEAVPDGFVYWLGGVSKTVLKARLEGLAPTSEVASAWNMVGVSTKALGEGGKCLWTPTWSQSAPFNGECSGCVTGCVPTAIAEVMRYYQWPDAPEQTKIPAGSSQAEYDLTGHSYDFASMPTSTSAMKSASNEVKADVAGLLRDIGAAVDIEYGSSASSAFSEYITERMGLYFKYNKAARRLMRTMYSESEWISLLKASIDADIPVLYDGENSYEGGHQFIVDGYDGNDFIHMNWGWGDNMNSYVAIGVNDFYQDQAALFDFVPDKTASSSFGNSSLYLSYLETKTTEYQGIKANGTISKGNPFSVTIGAIGNTGPRTYSGQVKLAFQTKDGSSEADLSSPTSFNLALERLSMFTISGLTIPYDIAFGDKIVIKYTYGDEWRDFPGDYLGETVTAYPAVQAAVIDLPSSCPSGSRLELRLINAPYRSAGRCDWYITVPGASSETKILPGASSSSLDSYDRYYYNFSANGKYRIRVAVKDKSGIVIDSITTSLNVE